jgi:hypothetical protein
VKAETPSKEGYMRKLVIGAAVGVMFAVPATATAAPSAKGQCRQDAKDVIIATLSPVEGTMGDAVSDGFYGNEPNEVDGHTVPSQSPGPKVTLPDGTVVRGSTWGDVQQNIIKPACNP